MPKQIELSEKYEKLKNYCRRGDYKSFNAELSELDHQQQAEIFSFTDG